MRQWHAAVANTGSCPTSYVPRVLDPGESQVLDVGVLSGLGRILDEPAGYSYPLTIRKFMLEGWLPFLTCWPRDSDSMKIISSLTAVAGV